MNRQEQVMTNADKMKRKIQYGIQIVTFRLGTENYGIPVAKVREIIRPMNTFPVPGLSEPVSGVINLRGEIIPVVKMHPVLGLEETPESSDEERKRRVIILDAESGGFGFVVDEVWEVIKVSSEDVQPPPEMGSGGIEADAVIGIVEMSGKMIICIEPQKLVGGILNTGKLAIECT
jgi:purine-binding chemotaxis protein CheW